MSEQRPPQQTNERERERERVRERERERERESTGSEHFAVPVLYYNANIFFFSIPDVIMLLDI